MEMQKRITGFMPMAKELITESPGLTAQEVYTRVAKLAEESGQRISASANPKGSLIPTLNKVYEDYGIERIRGKDGKYRFYLKGQNPSDDIVNYPSPGRNASEQPAIAEPVPLEDDFSLSSDTCCIKLDPRDSAKVRALVTLGWYSNEHAAHAELIKKGLETVLAKPPV